MQALVLAGGGAKGSFQARVEELLFQRGYRWGVIAGVSVGALNAAMLATGQRERLKEIWRTSRNPDVYRGGLSLWRAFQLWRGSKRSIYDNDPLMAKIAEAYDPNDTQIHTIFGVVSLSSGAYVQHHIAPDTTYDASASRRWLLASTAIPITFPPTRIGTDQFVDGGVRNITPLADVIPFEPEEIVVITTEPVPQPLQANSPTGILEDGAIVLQALLAEIIWNDIKWLRKINSYVEQAEAGGVTLRHPADDRPLKSFRLTLIMPDEDLGSGLDFSMEAYQRRVAAAERVMQRPLA